MSYGAIHKKKQFTAAMLNEPSQGVRDYAKEERTGGVKLRDERVQ